MLVFSNYCGNASKFCQVGRNGEVSDFKKSKRLDRFLCLEMLLTVMS